MSKLSKALKNLLGAEKKRARLERERLDKLDPERIYSRNWEERTQVLLASPDNNLIPRVPNAGRLEGGWVTMHNGLVVAADSYYGTEMMDMVRTNRGVHEPQEELVFQMLLPTLRSDAVMVELGSYWAFYSMWFMQAVGPGARCIMVEPEAKNMRAGGRNFDRNPVVGDREFVMAYAGRAHGLAEDGIPTVSVDFIAQTRELERLDLLHMDVQGAELDVLIGAADMLTRRAIDHVFVSTHSMKLHQECVGLLTQHGYQINADIDLKASYSHDGLIVASSPTIANPPAVRLARRPWVAKQQAQGSTK